MRFVSCSMAVFSLVFLISCQENESSEVDGIASKMSADMTSEQISNCTHFGLLGSKIAIDNMPEGENLEAVETLRKIKLVFPEAYRLETKLSLSAEELASKSVFSVVDVEFLSSGKPMPKGAGAEMRRCTAVLGELK